jgi:hypothetical protein
MSGSPYHWTDEVQRSFRALYDALARLEKEGYGKSPGNLQIALRSFVSSYDRWPAFYDSKLLDLITSLEALLGSGTEIAFRLSFRVAALIAPDDQRRGELLKLVKGFYDTRSRIVHGGAIGKKHQDRLQDIERLAEIVRRLLRSFVEFAIAPVNSYERSFWEEELDAALLDAAKREKLREALKLNPGRAAAMTSVELETDAERDPELEAEREADHRRLAGEIVAMLPSAPAEALAVLAIVEGILALGHPKNKPQPSEDAPRAPGK